MAAMSLVVAFKNSWSMDVHQKTDVEYCGVINRFCQGSWWFPSKLQAYSRHRPKAAHVKLGVDNVQPGRSG